MKIELALFDTDTRAWRGLTKIDGEMFKVHLFPGSATKDWEAVLMTGDFVELTPENKIVQAIKKAFDDYNKVSQPLTRLEVDKLAKLVTDNPDALEEIMRALKGGEEG